MLDSIMRRAGRWDIPVGEGAGDKVGISSENFPTLRRKNNGHFYKTDSSFIVVSESDFQNIIDNYIQTCRVALSRRKILPSKYFLLPT